MSVQLDEMFDEPPGVVAAVLSHAIESAGWRLVHVSESGDCVIWEVDQGARGPARLEATIEPHGQGARVRVVSVVDHSGPSGHPGGPGPTAPSGERADVIDLHPRVDGNQGFGPRHEPPPFGLS